MGGDRVIKLIYNIWYLSVLISFYLFTSFVFFYHNLKSEFMHILLILYVLKPFNIKQWQITNIISIQCVLLSFCCNICYKNKWDLYHQNNRMLQLNLLFVCAQFCLFLFMLYRIGSANFGVIWFNKNNVRLYLAKLKLCLFCIIIDP